MDKTIPVDERETVPVDEAIKVLDFVTIFKTRKWWKAVVLGEAFGRKSVSVYLWQLKNFEWKRVHKLKINSRDDWNKTREAVDQLIAKL